MLTGLPLPSKEKWQQASAQDHNINLIVQHLKNPSLEVEKKDLRNKTYLTKLNKNRLLQEDGILHRYEHSKLTSLRQLRTTVVPPPHH